MTNTCQCPKPPGGAIQCKDDELAVCGYQNGEIIGGCFERPQSIDWITNRDEKNLAIANWCLGVITGSSRSDYDAIEPEQFAMLRKGSYQDEFTGEIVKFVLPRDLNLTSAAKLRSVPG